TLALAGTCVHVEAVAQPLTDATFPRPSAGAQIVVTRDTGDGPVLLGRFIASGMGDTPFIALNAGPSGSEAEHAFDPDPDLCAAATQAFAALAATDACFDSLWYSARYGISRDQALSHYKTKGAADGLSPAPWFDENAA